MSHSSNVSDVSDADFVNHLRHMAAATPVIAVPGADTIVRAGRSRVARRRSVYAGAFGLALLAGAGLATMPQVGVVNPGVQPIAAVSEAAPFAPLDSRLDSRTGPSEPVAIAPLAQPTEVQLAADELVEAGSSSVSQRISPLATGLGIAGAASLGTAAGLAVRSRKLQPATVRA